MATLESRVIAWVIIAILWAAIPVQAQTGLTLTPTLSLAEIYDDNLFSVPSGRERDFITRVSPGLKGKYESEPMTLLGDYAFDAERFARHTELSDNRSRQRASAEFRYLPERRLALAVGGSYLKTQTPSELHPETGLETGRASARSFSLDPSMTLKVTRLTTVRMDYLFTHEESGDARTRTQTAAAGMDRSMTPGDTARLDYILHRFEFDGQATIRSQTVLLGWDREIRPSTRFTVAAGPRFSEEPAELEALATLHHRWRSGEGSLAYQKTQTAVIGLPGTVNTDSLSATLLYRPRRALDLSLSPGIFRNERGDFTARIFRAALEVTYRMTPKFSFKGSYQYSIQKGRLDSTADDEINHNLFALRFEAAFR